jgi:hypothetical protein
MLVSGAVLGGNVSSCLHPVILPLWQEEWTNAQGKKLRVVETFMLEWQAFRVVKTKGIALTHLRTSSWHIDIWCVLSWRLVLQRHIPSWTAQVMPKQAVSVILRRDIRHPRRWSM